MAIELIQPAEPPYDAHADSLGCWQDGIAFRRLEHLIQKGFETFMVAHREKPELTVSRHLALEIARAVPGVIDAVRGGA
jgi:hypothetical protein